MPRGLYEIDRILEGPDDNDRYLIKWVGYADKDNTWEPRCNLPDNALEEYLGVPVEGRNEEQDESDNTSVQNFSIRSRVGEGLQENLALTLRRWLTRRLHKERNLLTHLGLQRAWEFLPLSTCVVGFYTPPPLYGRRTLTIGVLKSTKWWS